jgi:glutamine amidotransferase-like uncharacterized protein
MECANGIMSSLYPDYSFKIFEEEHVSPEFLKDVDIVAFPGGVGNSDTYYGFFQRKKANMIAEFVEGGGRYLGICMGAYWAGPEYFDLLQNIKTEQYIKRPDSDVKRSFQGTAPVVWNGVSEQMYFYDGTAFIGDCNNFKTVATYINGDPMAIIQNRVGLIGCHPESEYSWYNKPYIEKYWHHGRHHTLLKNFVDKLMAS